MHLHHFLAKESTDKGPLLILPCLRCDDRQPFHLYTEAFGINLFGLKIALTLDYMLRCPACNEQNPYTFSICWKCGSEHITDGKDTPITPDFDISHITEDKGINTYGTLRL